MPQKFTNSAMALILSANAIDNSDGANVLTLAARVASSYHRHQHEIGNNKKTKRRRRAKQFKLTASKSEADGGSNLSGADVGLLTGGRKVNSRRFLQDGDQDGEIEDVHSCPMPETCDPALCECVGKCDPAVGSCGYQCAAELHAVCEGVTAADGTVFTIDGCVAYPEYYRNTYCKFAACLVGGGSYVSCECGFYEDFCEVYKEDETYEDVEHLNSYCGIADCCKAGVDDDEKLLCLAKSPSTKPIIAPPSGGPEDSPGTSGVPPIEGRPAPGASPTAETVAPPTGTPGTDDGTVPAPGEAPSSAQSVTVMTGIAGAAAASLVAAVWSF